MKRTQTDRRRNKRMVFETIRNLVLKKSVGYNAYKEEKKNDRSGDESIFFPTVWPCPVRDVADAPLYTRVPGTLWNSISSNRSACATLGARYEKAEEKKN